MKPHPYGHLQVVQFQCETRVLGYTVLNTSVEVYSLVWYTHMFGTQSVLRII